MSEAGRENWKECEDMGCLFSYPCLKGLRGYETSKAPYGDDAVKKASTEPVPSSSVDGMYNVQDGMYNVQVYIGKPKLRFCLIGI